MSTSRTGRTDAEKQALNKQLETAGWGVFLIMLGAMWLMPDGVVPQGMMALIAGLVLLGLNAVRHYLGIPMSTGTLILGAFALASGISESIGIEIPLIPILVIVAGVSMLWKTLRQP